ncbi:hypothetical protein CKAN_02695100 [Cinnamomum micranthum f. kanehirae]|uniref:Uncharacterized protein n=1 Tax=Cinnamomum micranthum f. kanehirae TaxID=337451 RepID=A0A443Q3A3_9MAGN|nr:hypothetical protein CKAN_02695100 [Cinnamomum micranthum f. kanehirae]
MKRTGALVASMAAASATAISSSSSSPSSFPSHTPTTFKEGDGEKRKNDGDCRSCTKSSTTSTEKFAPRFDGLRFIETLVTAHR